MSNNLHLLAALNRLSVLQRESINQVVLQDVVVSAELAISARGALEIVTKALNIKSARWFKGADLPSSPALSVDHRGEWSVLRGRNAMGLWILDRYDTEKKSWTEFVMDESSMSNLKFAVVNLATPYRAFGSPVLKEAIELIILNKAILFEALAGGAFLSIISILISFYSMQVYDRVIPTGAHQTLLVLTLGVLFAVIIEYVTKILRSRLYERLINRVDGVLARSVYIRFLSIRLDQIPSSVGGLANQLRGYESVRAFLVLLTGQLVVDLPFLVILVTVVGLIAGPLLLVPLLFLCVSIIIGLLHAKKVSRLAQRSQQLANMKTGLLVESVEAAETIKSGQGGWRMLNRWITSTDDARAVDLEVRHISEKSQYGAVLLQQTAYIGIVALGAGMILSSNLTAGGLIACSMLTGRILGPVTQLSFLISGWANTRAALAGLDSLWALEWDNYGGSAPLLLETLYGYYSLDKVGFSFGNRPVLFVDKLKIVPGERIAVIGPIGSGKTTLLRMLSGLYKPSEGRVLLDDVDLSHLSKNFLSENIGFLQQDGRLLSGTLRENLILGLLDPGDDAILAVCKHTGLYDSVIIKHPEGLNQVISEGGLGLSSGQRQLVNFTRVFIRRPKVWLLDEPTASLDKVSERKVKQALNISLSKKDIMVVITHRLDFLELVDRVIVVANHRVVMDGPRDLVIKNLTATPNAEHKC